MTLDKYIQKLEKFTNRKSSLFNNYIEPKLIQITNHIKIEPKYTEFYDLLMSHFKVIVIKFNKFKTSNTKLMTVKLIDIINKNKIILKKLNKILSDIMEWYIILLIFI